LLRRFNSKRKRIFRFVVAGMRGPQSPHRHPMISPKYSIMAENPSNTATLTVLELLNRTSAFFKDGCIESPRASAEILLSHILGLERIDLYVHYDQPVTADELARFKEAVSRRAGGEPAAYIVGSKEFYGIKFSVSRDVLIPRPETEHLVDAALKWLSGPGDEIGQAACVLDLGTGSGAIAIALAVHTHKASVFASDISLPTLRMARQNAENQGVKDRIQLLCGDWFLPFKETGEAFDAIVSNPPYVRSAVIVKLQPEIGYEPRRALDGGADGLEAVRLILLQAHAFLKPGGVLLVEIGFDQRTDVETFAKESGNYNDPIFISDYSGWDRIVFLKKR